jgi:hypothetical protein
VGRKMPRKIVPEILHVNQRVSGALGENIEGSTKNVIGKGYLAHCKRH